MLGWLDRAIELYERCLQDVQENEPENLVARVRYATLLSYALTDDGQLERAQRVLGEIVDEGTDVLSEPGTQVKVYWSLARLAGLRGQETDSLAYARKALALVEATEDTVQLGRAHLLCGFLLVRQGDGHEAVAHLDRAEDLLGRRPAPADLAYLRTEQAKAALLLDSPHEAIARGREALELLGDTEPAEQGAAWLALARAWEVLDDQAEAFEAFRRSAGILEVAGTAHDAAEAYQSWGRALRAAGRESEALDALDRAAELGVGRRTGAPAERTV
jgi:tetratricopeptide (TPR) repeat protein